MKLFVDDIRNAPDDSWTVARTVGAAIRALYMFAGGITEISLDHDISHQIGMGAVERPFPCDETFQPVAHYLGLLFSHYELTRIAKENAPVWVMPEITLHTSNSVGAVEMQKILMQYDLKSVIKLSKPANRLEQIV